MDNSIATPKAVRKPAPKADKTVERLVELSERINYVVKMLQDHADAINRMQSKLDQVRNRMGL